MNEPADSYTLDTNKEAKSKFFYVPDITQKDLSAGKVKVLEYIQPNNITVERYYASKVLPGQSLRQAVIRDLSKDFGYTGRVNIEPEVVLLDNVIDKRDEEVPRYEVTLSLLDEFDIESAKPLGCDLKWSEYELLQSPEYDKRDSGQYIRNESKSSLKTVNDGRDNENDELMPKAFNELTPEDRMKLEEILMIQKIIILDDEIITIEALDFNPKISVTSDWKWNDQSVFSQLKEVIPEASIEYEHESGFEGEIHMAGFNNFEDYVQSLGEPWRLTFKAFGEKNTITLERLNISALFDLINSLIEPKLNKKFINLETFGDYYLFLLAPADIDEERFNRIIYKY